MTIRAEVAASGDWPEWEVPDRHRLRWRGRDWTYWPADASLRPADPAGDGVPGRVRLPLPDPEPVGLVLALHRDCNLSCRYCYAGRPRSAAVGLPMSAIAAAASRVARRCRDEGLDLWVSFHGDNEPLLRPERIEQAVVILHQVASQAGVGLRLACTTNGVVPTAVAAWSARVFDRVTVSYDGTPDLQDRQRPASDGAATSAQVQRTLDRLSAPDGPAELVVRTTVTRDGQDRQAEMVAHLLSCAAPRRLVFQPVYPARHAPEAAALRVDPGRFVAGFLHARVLARSQGVPLELPETRPDQVHGRHCTLLQRQLLLTADGEPSLCVMALDARYAWDRRRLFGHWDAARSDLAIRVGQAADCLESLRRPRPVCRGCLNLWHCAQGCPGVCGLDGDAAVVDCRIPFWVGIADILERAGLPLEAADLPDLLRLRPPLPHPVWQERADG